MLYGLLSLVLAVGVGALALVYRSARRRGLDCWLPGYVATRSMRGEPRRDGPFHVLMCITDHFEPQHGNAPAQQAMARVESWVRGYPKLFDRFRDADGRPPQHTFFYPLEMYSAAEVDGIAELCRAGYGEIEVHLHHDDDTAENLRRTLLDFKQILSERHRMLGRDRKTGELKYGFVHGNWALDNSRPDGRWCGVNNELDVLRETGCYADFTMPSAPSDTQTRKINSIYWATDDPKRPKSHDTGVDVGGRAAPRNALMLIQGPLLLNWHRRKWGIVPKVENACIQRSQAPSMERLDLWIKARVHVPARPDWLFGKLHTHGATEANQAVLLGDPMVRFHEALARRAEQDSRFRYHYVTAREMYNLARAAEAGWEGSVEEARDFELSWRGGRSADVQAAAPSGN